MKLYKLFWIFLLTPLFLYSGWKEEKESLEKVYFVDEFRVFYSLNGKHQLPKKHQKDINKNNIPDYVEDIALQLQASSTVFTKTLGFVHPLESKRYKGIVKHIDVHILNSKSGGGAGDAIINYDYKRLDKKNKALAINLSNNLKYHSLTPMHEMFHLIQNGYTMFKNGWYTEGTARWSESVFKKGVGKKYKLPSTKKELEDRILNSLYKTSVYWNKLAFLCGKKRTYKIPNINNYYTDGALIIEDNRTYGYDFIKTLLENFESKDKKASFNMNYKRYNWLEKNQKSSKNNPYLLCSIKETIYDKCYTINLELKNFIKVIDEYTDNRCKY